MSEPKQKIDYFSSDSLRQNLRSKTVRGGMTTAAAQGVRLVVGLLTIPILTRLLEPEDFGLIAMVLVFTGFATMFVNSGISTATIQRESITSQQCSNLFWIGALLGLLVAAITAACSPLVGWIYGEPRLVPITLALACSFLFVGLTIQHQAMLKRGMQFQALAATQLLSLFAGQGAGIAWAWIYRDQEYDYWALVITPLVTGLVLMASSWAFVSWRPSLPRRDKETRELIGFGADLTMFTFVNYFARNADNLLIGLVWGKVPLGFYERAYKLLLLPMQQVGPPFTSVVLPALSRLQSDPQRYRQAYLTAMRTICWASMPIVGLLACTSDPFIELYMGPQWAPVAPLLEALLPAAWANCFILGSGWAFTTSGRVKELLRWGVIHSSVLVAVMLVCVPFGVLAVAWGVSIAYVIMRVPGFIYCFRGTPMQLMDMVRVLKHPTLASGIAAAAALVLRLELLAGLGNIQEFAITATAYSVLLLVYAVALPGAREDFRHVHRLTRLSSQKTAG